MKKKILTFGILAALCFSMLSCGTGSAENAETEKKMEEGRLDVVQKDDLGPFGEYSKIIVDRKTGVMYLFVKDGYGGGLSIMVDKDGYPLLWEDGK